MTEQEMQELFPLIDRLTQTTHKIDKENQRLRKALEFYADKDNTWEDGDYEGGLWFSIAERDKGAIARKALEESE